jgi:DNA end-binding protein Ku
VVIHSKQHLAVVLPCGPALVLNLLRWGGEIRSWQDLPLPPQGKAAGIKDAEMKMARQLIADMSGHWSAEEFRDNFHDAVMKLVAAKAKAGDTETVEPLEEAPAGQGADVIDLTELLRRSLRGGAKVEAAPAAHKSPRTAAKRGSSSRKAAPERAVAAAAPRKRAATKKAASKTSRARRAA